MTRPPATRTPATRRPAALLAGVALAGAMAGCGGGEDRTQVAAEVSASASSASPSSVAPSSPAAPAASQSAVAPAGSTDLTTEEPVGGPLTVTEVRVARQDGFDRVVLELDGEQAGEPGWRVEYVDAPSAQGSGEAVEVEGDAVLAVVVTGTGYPFDTGVEEVNGDPTLPSDLEVVTDVQLGAVFEGQYEAFIGLSSEQPFTVTRLGDPARVVIDVTHP